MAKVKVTLTVPNIYETEGVRILSGENFFESSEIVKLLANPIVKNDIKAGILIIEELKEKKTREKNVKAVEEVEEDINEHSEFEI